MRGIQKGFHSSPESLVRSEPGLELPAGRPLCAPPPRFPRGAEASGAWSPSRVARHPSRGSPSPLQRVGSDPAAGGADPQAEGDADAAAGEAALQVVPVPERGRGASPLLHGPAERPPTPGKVPGPRGSPSLAYCRALRGAGCPLAVEPRAAAAQRRAPPAPGPFAGSPRFPSQTILWRGPALVGRWREPRGALSLVGKVQHRSVGWGTERGHIASASSFPSAEAVKGTPCAIPAP